MATQDDLKREVARAALRFVPDGEVIGVGTGSTADFFIDVLGALRGRIAGAVPSSERSAKRLAGHGIPLFDLNDVETLAVYVDGADEIDARLLHDQGGRRRSHAREDRRGGRADVRVHCRPQQAGVRRSVAFRCRSKWFRWRAPT